MLPDFDALLTGANLTEITLSETEVQVCFTVHMPPTKTSQIPPTISFPLDSWEVVAPDGKSLDHSQENSKRAEYRIHRLLGKKVKEVRKQQGAVEIVFEDSYVLKTDWIPSGS
jgi:hypothetical protein